MSGRPPPPVLSLCLSTCSKTVSACLARLYGCLAQLIRWVDQVMLRGVSHDNKESADSVTMVIRAVLDSVKVSTYDNHYLSCSRFMSSVPSPQLDTKGSFVLFLSFCPGVSCPSCPVLVLSHVITVPLCPSGTGAIGCRKTGRLCPLVSSPITACRGTFRRV